MALSKREVKAATELNQKGANPELIAKLLNRDKRVVLDALATQNRFGPWEDIPHDDPSPQLRQHVRAIATKGPRIAIRDAIKGMRQRHEWAPRHGLNLVIKTIVEEREKIDTDST